MTGQNEVDRRTFLSGLGVSTLLLSRMEHPNASRTIQDLIQDRKDYLEQHPGQKVLFGDINDAMSSQKIGRVSSFIRPRLKEALDNGVDPEDIYEGAKESVGPVAMKAEKREPFYLPIEDQRAELAVLYVDEGETTTDLGYHVEQTKSSLEQLFPEVNVRQERLDPKEEVNGESIEARLDNWNEGNHGLSFSQSLTEEGELPLILVERDLRNNSTGYACYSHDYAVNELTGSEDHDISTSVHEAGHILAQIPHHYLEEGVMSYNPETREDTHFSEFSRTWVDAYIEGEESFEVNEIDAYVNGEMTQVPEINRIIHPKEVRETVNEEYSMRSLQNFLNSKFLRDQEVRGIEFEEDYTFARVVSKGSGQEYEFKIDHDLVDVETL